VVAGLVPALVVGGVFVRVPGTWVAASAFAATCLAVGAAVGPTVAFGPATRPTRPGRPGQPGQPWAPYGPGLLLLGAVLGAPVGAVAGVQAAAPVAAFASPGWSVLIAGGWVGAVVGACGGTVLAAVRSNPAASSA
ncbi:MAG: hypothetical protein INR67_17790, partial [Jatrophihabitans endophyticus]|nr:hypothetical protein [Jatrophihabitans endophyticus]